MPDSIRDGSGKGYLAKVTSDNRITVDAITELVSSERSRLGQLFGVGTGFLTTSGAMSTVGAGGVLWLRNDSTDEDLYVQKLVPGWNGGNTNHNKTCHTFIKYQTGEPSANHTAITDAIENISLAGAAAVSSGKTTAYKWDGTGNGMTTSGGFLQIPNTIYKGMPNINIDGEIILGPGDAMEMQVIDTLAGADGEAGIVHLAIVYYFAPAGLGRSFI